MGTQITELTTEVLVVGGGVGGTAAALQTARRGVKTILVSEGPWLGGMLTSAGVAAPDGNELAAWQTGIWGQFLRTLKQQQPEGLDHSWVSLFTFDPRMGAKILADWVQQLPNLTWIANQTAVAVIKQGAPHSGSLRDRHTEYVCEETGDEVILMKNQQGEVIGFEKLNYSLVTNTNLKISLETVIAT